MRLKLMSVVLFISFLMSCDPRMGFIESNFTLATESRLPRWFAAPEGVVRSDIKVEIILYGPILSDNNVKIIIRNLSSDDRVLDSRIGIKRPHPLTNWEARDKFPRFSIITIAGIEEVFEQKQLEPILYISDDPRLTSGLRGK